MGVLVGVVSYMDSLCFKASLVDADQLVNNMPPKMFTDIFVRNWIIFFTEYTWSYLETVSCLQVYTKDLAQKVVF